MSATIRNSNYVLLDIMKVVKTKVILMVVRSDCGWLLLVFF